MTSAKGFSVVFVDLEKGESRRETIGDRFAELGGSGLAAQLYREFGLPAEPWDHPQQPLIFAIGQLTGYFPLMSKVVCGFKSPYHDQYSESHAGGRLALALRFAGADAVVLTGRAPNLSAAMVSATTEDVRDVHYLRGKDVFQTGRLMREMFPQTPGHRSIIRIGPAGENRSHYACINVDTYRHFGRMGAGAVMGAKNLKAMAVHGDANLDLPQSKDYPKIFRGIYKQLTDTHMMSKYHDLGTPQNLIPLNELKSLPWRNLQATSDPGVEGVSGERFAKQLLLRNTACSGCPVGCIHVGLLREQFADEHQFKYRQVNYDYEPIFAMGTMLGVTDASEVLALLDEVEKVGLDVMSCGVALAWATEAFEKGVVSEEDLLYPLAFGDAEGYKLAVHHLAHGETPLYEALARGALVAAREFGGEDYACVLGQEMAGYATGEVYFASQSLSFRHSHLDTGAYSLDQTSTEKDPEAAVRFLVDDERGRVLLTSLVACLFSRKVYTDEAIADCLRATGYEQLAENLDGAAHEAQKLRWKVRLQTGYDPGKTRIPKRFLEVETWKGSIDAEYLDTLRRDYGEAIRRLGG